MLLHTTEQQFECYYIAFSLSLTHTHTHTHNLSTIENYVKWHLVKRFLPYLSEDFTNAYQQFSLATGGMYAKLILMCLVVSLHVSTHCTIIHTHTCVYRKSGNFRCKNTNVVGVSYENLSYENSCAPLMLMR